MKEQMNRDIIKQVYEMIIYAGLEPDEFTWFVNTYELTEELGNWYWQIIMPVWQKLRGELVAIENLENNKDEYDIWLDKAMLFGKSRAYTQLIEKAIAQDTDITAAHKLIHEAITLIKK